MNTVLGEELSIVSTTPQTTRKNLKGIYNAPGMQLVFVDTPGIHRGKHAFNVAMIDEAVRSLSSDVDVACYIVDLAREFGEEEDEIATIVARLGIPRILLFNKKDICDNPAAMMKLFFERYPSLAAVPHEAVTAKEPQSKETFLKLLDPFVPVGPAHFPADDLTDANTRFFAAEYIRKQILYNTREEVPHAAFVEITDYRELPDRHQVDAMIYVETDGQKAIVIGAGGKLIKKIQARAAEDLAKLTGVPATISCHVRIHKDWRDDERFLKRAGYGR
jgi:GTP-binding protein Era